MVDQVVTVVGHHHVVAGGHPVEHLAAGRAGPGIGPDRIPLALVGIDSLAGEQLGELVDFVDGGCSRDAHSRRVASRHRHETTTPNGYIRSGASTPISPRAVANTRRVARQRANRLSRRWGSACSTGDSV